MLDPIGLDEERSVALAVDRDDKHSFYALQWTTDVLLSKGQTLTLIHVHQPKPIPTGNSDFSNGQDPDDQCTDVFLPYRVFCSSREVSCDTVMLEDQDIGKALIDYVSLYRVQNLVLGTQSKSKSKSKRAIPRKLFNIKGDLASTIMKGAPGYCSVYTIAKGNKIAFAREASHPLKWSLEKMHNNIPQRKLITSASYMCRSRTQDEVIQERLSTDLSSYTCSHGRLSTDNAFLGLYRNLRSDLWSSENNNNNNADDDLAWSELGNCSTPRVSNFSRTKGFNFTRGLVDSSSTQMNSVDIDDIHFSNEESRPDSIPSSPTTFEGTIPPSLIISKRLIELKLNNNAFDGRIPYMRLPKLKYANFSNNYLEGEIPPVLSHFPSSAFQGNTGLCGEPLKPCILPQLSLMTLVVVTIVVGAAVLSIVAVVIILRHPKPPEMEEGSPLPSSHRRMASLDLDKLENGSVASLDSSNKSEPGLRLTFLRDDRERFDLASLLKASAEILGSGVFGSTYKAAMNDGAMIVVKRFRQMNNVGKEDFYEHMRRLGSLNHNNLLPISAFYYRKEEKLLVADYVQNVSLAVHLHVNKSSGSVSLDWATRLKIMKGVARGLMYLYNELPELISPHGHLKSSNVLLNESFEPLHTDYGLLPVVNMEHAQKHMVAYKSPEYRRSGRISKKTDVWALGILIVETLTGKLPSGFLQQGNTNDVDIAGWVHSVAPVDSTPAEVFDKDMVKMTGRSRGQMMKLLKIGLMCCEVDVEKRLDIKEAVERIEEVRERDNDDDDDDDEPSRGESQEDFGQQV